MRVITTDASQRLRVKIKEFGRVVGPGEQLTVDDARYNVLHGGNRYGAVFVERVVNTPSENVEPVPAASPAPEAVEPEIIEEPEVVVVKPKRKRTTKKKESSEE